MPVAIRVLLLAFTAVALVAALGLVVVRDHPAPEHTRAFAEEDKAARALLAAARGKGTLDAARALLGGRRAWITVHAPEVAGDRTLAIADVASLTAGADDVLQVDVEIAAPLGASITGPARAGLDIGLDAGLDGAVLPNGAVRTPAWFLERGYERTKLGAFFAAEGATVLRSYALVETRSGPKRLLLGTLLPEANVDGPRLLAAAALGGSYLAAHQKPDGRYHYEIDASSGQESRGYNAVRHAGATYALLQLHRQRADAALLAAADRSLAWLVDGTRDDPRDPHRAFLDDGKKVKLGGSALTLLAMVERLRIADPPPGLRESADKLARFLVAQQDDDGRFASYATPSAAYQPDERDSIYYPGEAVLALARYDVVAGDRSHFWRATAEKGARYLVNDRHRALGIRVRMPVDAWLLLAIELLDRPATPLHGGAAAKGRLADDDELLVHGQRITRQIMREMHVAADVPLPMRGARADRDFGSLISTGSRMEALAAAAAIEARREPSSQRVRQAAIANAAYGMRFQFDEDRLFLTSARARALGGVPTSVTDPRVRIDGVQHNLSGWLLLAAVLEKREAP